MKDQLQIHSKSVGTSLQAELFFLSCSRDKLWVVVVHFVQLYFVNAPQRTSIQCLQIHLTHHHSRSTSGDIPSDEALLMNLLLMTHHHSRSTFSSRALLFRCFKLPFCWFLCSLLLFQNLIMISNVLSMVLYTWKKISISNWQFLIPCYHQNSKEVMLNTFCSNTAKFASGMLATAFPLSSVGLLGWETELWDLFAWKKHLFAALMSPFREAMMPSDRSLASVPKTIEVVKFRFGELDWF